ncbi:hypothetical protein L6452_00380 [Arctium lappa]|uniref:Uncharacterized protein n=1 Tax=Arctium lappa TaxID=4217 RepID=A0ACB9FDV6_ARCLA|nr:hypothetical protein L6452_00380 [Arctium lappa]
MECIIFVVANLLFCATLDIKGADDEELAEANRDEDELSVTKRIEVWIEVCYVLDETSERSENVNSNSVMYI